MKPLTEIAMQFDTDKTQSQGYLDNFERHFSHLRDKPVKILELGVFHGGSLLMWQEYFPNGLIVGLDRHTNPLVEPQPRIRFYQGSQDEPALLDRLSEECATDGFDIVVDDASHIGTLSRASFQHLFKHHLKPGGVYVIEDWGTGYWKTWPDGATYQPAKSKHFDANRVFILLVLRRLAKRLPLIGKWLQYNADIDPNFASHNFGMTGFVKELIDEVAWQDITHPQSGNDLLKRRLPCIKEITIYPGHVFVTKVTA